MSYLQLAYLHLATIFPAFLIGGYLLLFPKGTIFHKKLGKIYMLLMLITASISLLMPAQVGPSLAGHFGWIHILSFSVFYFIPRAFFAIRKGDISTHKQSMQGLYIGGMLIAGAFTFTPGRLIHQWLISS